MAITPLVQREVFDVASWDKDAEFAVFPQGARAKDAVFAPAAPRDAVLVPSKRYLFKKSKQWYPDQFWGEIIAYRIGCLMGLQVPPAFVAINSETEQCGALIEWFYRDGHERFVLAGDYLQTIRQGYDREKGTHHNLQDVQTLMRMFLLSGALRSEWRDWWGQALLFDALIGNTDRHQDNWGLIFEVRPDERRRTAPCSLAPLFDNGTSLGHELFPTHVANWDEGRWQSYIRRGTHHIKWALDQEPMIRKHLDLLSRVLAAWPALNVTRLRECISFDERSLHSSIMDIAQLPVPVPLTRERIEIAYGLVIRRLRLLRELLDAHLAPSR